MKKICVLTAVILNLALLKPVSFALDGKLIKERPDFEGASILLIEPRNTSSILSFFKIGGIEEVDLFAEVMATFMVEYYKDFDSRKFAEKVLEGGISEFDKFSRYANPKQQKNEDESMEGYFYGIGTALGQKTEEGENFIVVNSVMDGSPAMKAGIQSGDYLISISSDGDKNHAVSADDLSIDETVGLIRGKENSKVYLKIRRKDKELEFIITRKEVKVAFLEGKSLKPGIGYARLREFRGKTTPNDFVVLVSSLQVNGARVLILDLRNNPGGWLAWAVKINNLFRVNDSRLPIVILKRKTKNEVMNGDATTAGKLKNLRVILLVNYGSASASEIVAAYLKNYCNALVIGKTTFGKGVGQSVFNLVSGGKLIVTSFEYFVGEKEIKVHEIGVKPDIEVDNIKEDKTDKQLQRAIEEAEKILNIK